MDAPGGGPRDACGKFARRLEPKMNKSSGASLAPAGDAALTAMIETMRAARLA
jgi:hypothetical protein